MPVALTYSDEGTRRRHFDKRKARHSEQRARKGRPPKRIEDEEPSKRRSDASRSDLPKQADATKALR